MFFDLSARSRVIHVWGKYKSKKKSHNVVHFTVHYVFIYRVLVAAIKYALPVAQC